MTESREVTMMLDMTHYGRRKPRELDDDPVPVWGVILLVALAGAFTILMFALGG